jgi:hypothetical protein
MNRASLQVQLLDGYETLENEIRLISEVVKLMPEHVSIIDMWLRCELLLDTYLQKRSLKPSYIERLSVSTLDSFDKEEIQQKRYDSLNSAKKAGFDLIEVIDAQFDESQYDEFVRVYEEIINDMPVEELTTEQRLLTVDKIRDFYDSNRKNGMRFITYLAIHDSGEIAGFTQTTLNEYHPEVSEQGDTGIIRKYRGHGLGLALKYQSLNYLLKKTDVKYWMTGNAASNEHMIRINDILLYKPWITAHEYEIDVARIADLFGAPEG